MSSRRNGIYVPARGLDDWEAVTRPEHWKEGFSARTLAYSWQHAQGLPTEVKRILRRNSLFRDLELLVAIPEYGMPLPGGNKGSQSDVWAICKCSNGLVSLAIEGKVSEAFGERVMDCLRDASPGLVTRIRYLQDLLGIDGESLGPLRYQLLHRTASAIVGAQRIFAHHAVMLVHSFGGSDANFADYCAFAAHLGGSVVPKKLTYVGPRYGIELYLGWADGDVKYLDSARRVE